VIYFIGQWKKSKIESEILQKESIKSQLLNLKNHLDPHFLFNNLNILSSLIEKGEKNSAEYINKFAEVYRYMLQNNTKELIILSEELEFIHSYLQLIKMRFQNALRFDVDIPSDKLDLTIPPLTIQMLIENCIKHNTLNEANPLIINIKYQEGDYLLIQNNITARRVKFQSNGSGLENIRNRYRFFTEKEVVIENNGALFKVLIPLIELEEI
jgi:LytS/YehU family sensor histidine kinase